MNDFSFTPRELYKFLDKAGKATYAGGGKEVEPERKDFHELEYRDGDFYYRDSYAGHYRSRGMEIVRYEGKPVWASLYGGGMVEGRENLANQTFEFLKKAMSNEEKGFESLRGPHEFLDGDWKYSYEQSGDVYEFNGYEEIYYKDELVFFHRIIGGRMF